MPDIKPSREFAEIGPLSSGECLDMRKRAAFQRFEPDDNALDANSPAASCVLAASEFAQQYLI
ncbi:MAG: hypothetical protein EPN70_22870 [Paraburkholderia sp.]|uniref:hypothetical protein n=1 Tax=Paraburkholderia sp. TaxID=1926495 RepID=UPI00121D889D|nr:hypothetical protein [Paraburkholderia sp.]TAM00284.1 MAG: hypothetical protein EPN70_22870 [Paraburkholderia sp.]